MHRFGAATEPEVRREVARAMLDQVSTMLGAERLGDAERAANLLLARFTDDPQNSQEELLARTLYLKARVVTRMGRAEEGLDLCMQVASQLQADRTPEARILVAKAMNAGAAILDRLGRSSEAVEMREVVMARFGDARVPELREAVARARLGNAVALGDLGYPKDAVSELRNIIVSYESELPPAPAYIAADARFELIRALSQLSSLDDGVVECDALIERYGQSDAPRVRLQVAKTMWLKCRLLGRYPYAEHRKAAMVMLVLDELLLRYGAATEPELQAVTSRALQFKARLALEHDRPDEGIAASDVLVARIRSEKDPRVISELARRLVDVGDDLLRARLFDQAVKLLGAVLMQRRDPRRILSETRAQAMYYMSLALAQLDRDAEALTCLDDLLTHFGDAPEWEMYQWPVRALAVKAQLLVRSDEIDKATVVSAALASRFERDLPGNLLLDIGGMVLEMGIALFSVGQFEQALRAFGVVVTRCADATEPQLRRLTVHALSNISAASAQLGRTSDAIAAHERMLSFGEDAIAAFDESAARCEGSPTPARRTELLNALLSKATVLHTLGRRDEALAVLRDLLRRFDGDQTRGAEGTLSAAHELYSEIVRES